MSELTPTSSETSARPLITLAPEGDVILDISDSPATSDYNDHPHTQYLVASQVLCVASPVFRTMFSKTSPFEEAASLYDPTRTMPITVTLEDNPGAFEIVLDVLHLRNRHVERQLQLPTLLAIAKISDKYQLYEALMLVTDLWRTTIMNMDAALPEKVILAWAFRYEGLFRETTREILKQSFYVRRHRLVLVQGFSLTWLSECLPECLIEAIIEKRNQFIDSIKTRLEFYRTERWAWGHSVCTSECDSLQWGYFLRMSGRYQLEDQCTWLRSVNSFSSMLKSIPKVRCARRSTVSGDHTWNSDLHRVIDEGLMEFENGLSLSEFPSREVGG